MTSRFYDCLQLKYLNISSFENNISNDKIFNNLPNSGTLLVNINFFDKIRNQIPKNWEIIIIPIK